MDAEDSILLRRLRGEYNRKVDAYNSKRATDPEAEPPNPEELFDEVIYHSEQVWPDRYKLVKKHAAARFHFRARDTLKIKRHLLKRYAAAFRSLDQALAAGEFVTHSLTGVMAKDGILQRRTDLLGIIGTMGGLAVKHLLLVGMHARMIVIGTEISHLLQVGFPEAAAARARTLYELVVKALLIVADSNPNKFELAERYYVSATLEWQGQGGDMSDESIQEMLMNARSNWGPSFFEGDNNWALPAMGEDFRKRRVTFRDLEDALDIGDLRHMYVECNQSVHAGALRIVGSADFRRNYLYATGSVIDLNSTGRIGQASVYYLEMATYFLVRGITSELKEWDSILDVTDFLQRSQAANKLFYEGYEHPG